MNGKKTYMGLLAAAIGIVGKYFAPEHSELWNALSALGLIFAGVGATHKLAKQNPGETP